MHVEGAAAAAAADEPQEARGSSRGVGDEATHALFPLDFGDEARNAGGSVRLFGMIISHCELMQYALAGSVLLCLLLFLIFVL